MENLVAYIIGRIIIITVIVVSLIFGIAYWLHGSLKEKGLPVICRKPSYIIKAHERRTYFVDKIEYPDHQLTKQEIINYSDSIEKYNQLLKD